ncbi:Sensor histidine kinase YpdA [compost metagenome]
MLRYLSDSKKIELILDVPDTFPRVFADENRLIQILFNLLHNAIKYTNEGFIVLSAEVRKQRAYIFVRDTGIGMDRETQQRIFLPYEQGNTYAEGGLGLGLSICKQLVELHGSTLELRSEPRHGSVFSFSLPLMAGAGEEAGKEAGGEIAAGEAVEEQQEAPWSLVTSHELAKLSNLEEDILGSGILPCNNHPKIIAVDDDPVNLKILQYLLSAEKYHISAVTNAEEALLLLDSGEWDLVISDVMMPHISGYELTRKIRSKYSISELPILLLTASSRPQDIETGFKAGANDYLSKPMDGLELKTRVRALIQLKQSIMERLRMEAAWLQAQIQPHFLFNTLNSVASLSVTDTSRMAALLERFGSYLRTSFDVCNLQRVVPIEHELELLRSYLYIEKERFGDRLQVVWDLQEYSMVHLPPLSIQPIVENSVRHGLLTRVSGGTVTIRILDRTDHTEIIIEDDGVGIEEEKLQGLLHAELHPRRGIGLINTDRRLKQLYGQGLRINSVGGEGTTVAFTIPKAEIIA